jgi:hypothetical protein
MYARLTTIVFGEDEDYEAETIFRNVIPSIEELAGFKGMIVLSGLDEQAFIALTLWETSEALAAAEPVLEGLKRGETAYRQVETVETSRYYVAGSRLR